MTQRLKITISDTAMAELKRRAELEGVPIARVAAVYVGQRVGDSPRTTRLRPPAPRCSTGAT